MMVAGFDLATRRCGWAVGDGTGAPEVGVWEYPQVDDDLGALLHAFHGSLIPFLELWSPDHVIYESPVMARANTLSFSRKVHALGGMLELACYRRNISVSEGHPYTLKRVLAGSHKASKDEMVKAARDLGVLLPKGPGAKDAADASAAWLHGTQCYNIQLRANWGWTDGKKRKR